MWGGGERNPVISDIPVASAASRQSVSHLVLYWRVEGVYMHGGGKGEILPYLTYLLHLLLQDSLFLIWYSTGGLRGVYMHGGGKGEILPYLTYLLHLLLQGNLFLTGHFTGCLLHLL